MLIFIDTRRSESGLARTNSGQLPVTCDAPFSGRSGLPAGAVGGFYFLHASMVLFFAPLSHSTPRNSLEA